MDFTIFDSLQSCWRSRKKRLFALWIVAGILVVAVVRAMPMRYKAQMTYVAQTNSGGTGLSLTSVPLMPSLSALDRDSMITSQETILRSMPLFEQVRSMGESTDFETKSSSKLRSFLTATSHELQSLFFGEEYVQTRDKWRNVEFKKFGDRLDFDADLGAGTFTIWYADETPVVALDMTKKIGIALEDINVGIGKDRARKIAEFLRKKLDDARRSLDESSSSIADFMQKNNFNDAVGVTEAKYKILLQTQSELDHAIAEQAEHMGARSVLAKELGNIENFLQSDLKGGLSLRREAVFKSLLQLESTLIALEPQDEADKGIILQRIKTVKSQLTKDLTSGTNILAVDDLRQLIVDIRKSLLGHSVAETVVKKRIDLIRKRVDEFNDELNNYPHLQSELQKLVLVHNQNISVVTQLMAKYLDAQVESEANLSQIYVIDGPMVVPLASTSSKLKLMVTGVLMAAAFVYFLVTLWDFSRGTILIPEHLSRRKVPRFIGRFPHIPGRLTEKSLRSPGAKDVINRLVLTIQRRLHGKDAKPSGCLGVTSASMGAGKSTTVLGIANGLRSKGHSVAIIDADIHADTRCVKNYATTVFPSLFSVFAGHKFPEVKGSDFGLVALTEDSESEDVASFNFESRLKAALDWAHRHFEYVLIDCSPVFFSETMVVMDYIDAAIICCAEGKSGFKELDGVVETLTERIDANQLFTVLTNSKQSGFRDDDALVYQYRVTKRVA